MQGKLTKFEAKMLDGQHDKFKDFFKFIVTIEEEGKTYQGECLAKLAKGSKSWQLGAVHEYERKENSYAEGGYSFSKLKAIESQPGTQNTPQFKPPSASFDIQKEAGVISRFSHTLAFDYFKNFTDEQLEMMFKKEYEKDHPIASLAKSFCRSVMNRAKEVQVMYAGGDSEAS